jgi:hypothetical protein
LWLIGSDWWKVPFDDKRRHSFNMATMALILDFISVHYLTNAWVDWLSTSRMDTWHTAPPDFAISPNSQRYNIQVGAYATPGVALV